VAVVVTAALAVAFLPRPAAADDPPPLAALRAQRAVLVRRIAVLTDQTTRAQAVAAAAATRRDAAQAVAEDARLHVARFAVDAFVDGVKAPEIDQLRMKGFTDIATSTARWFYGQLQGARDSATREADVAQQAVDDARATTDELNQLRAELEQTIAEREAADAAAAEARRKATSAVRLTTHPRHAATTRSQAELMARYPFGPVDGIPAGLVATGQVVAGKASWYGPGFDGRPTASGAIFDQEGFTVASKELPLGTILLIHRGGRSVLALVNDRGPFVAGRVLDLSHGVANALGTVSAGVAAVTAEVLVPQ